MAKERYFTIVPDLSSPDGYRRVPVEPKPAVHIKSYQEIHDEVWGIETGSVVEVLGVVNGLLQDINKVKAEKSKKGKK